MSLGVPYVSPLPTPGVTPSPQFEAMLIAHSQETETKLEQKVAGGDIAIATGDFATHGVRTFELAAAGASLVGATYDAANLYASAAGAGNTASKEIPVQVGQRLVSVSVSGRNSGVAWSMAVVRIDKVSGGLTTLGSASSGAVGGTIEKKFVTLTEVVLAGFAYVARWTAGGAGDRFLGGDFGVDRP